MSKKLISTVLTVVVSVFAVSGLVYAASRNITGKLGGASGDQFQLDGILQVNSLKVGAQGSGGVTYFNGSIINNTTSGGVDNPVTFGDNVRIDGKVYRGSTIGPTDSKPFIIDDNAQITGNLTVAGAMGVGSITGLSDMVSAAGFAQTSTLSQYAKLTDLGTYAKTTDLTPYAKTTDLGVYAKATDLTPYAKTTDLGVYALTTAVSTLSSTVDVNYYWQYAIYQYNRCVLNLDQSLTYPTMDDMLFCWDNWVGTSLATPSFVSPNSTPSLDATPSKIDDARKFDAETHRAMMLNE